MIPVGSGTLSLTKALASARTETGGPAAPGAIGSYSIYTTTAHPNTGNTIQGWRWDQRTWYSERDENSDVALPVNLDPTTSGITSSYFQSGIGSHDDLKYLGLSYLPSSGLTAAGIDSVWAPKINHGHYYDYQDARYLFADDSESVYLTLSGLAHEGFNRVRLLSVPKVGTPVNVIRYVWDNVEGKYDIALQARKRVFFTGQKQADNTRLSTWNASKGIILWDNIDNTEPEFMVLDSGADKTTPEVIMNGLYVDQYPSASTYEELGISTGSTSQSYRTLYSPLDANREVEIVSYITATGVHTSWSGIAFSGVLATGLNQVRVDYDLGLLEFGSTTSGVNVPAAGHTVAARYWRTMHVEYEPEQSNDYVIAHEATTNPVYRESGRGFVYLATSAQDPASIVLTAEAPQIQSNVYGPVFLGNSIAPVIGTVYDSVGNLLEGQTVTFFITSTPVAGGFGATGTSTTALTNGLGRARAYYASPKTINEIGEYITASGFSTNSSPVFPSGATHTTTLSTSNILIEGDVNDIALYQVLVDDPSQGWRDVTVSATNEDLQYNSFYTSYFGEEDIWGPTGLLASGVSYSGAMSWEIGHREAWNLLQPKLFDVNLGNGKKVLTAVYNSGVLNPHTFTEGAVAPFRPSRVSAAGGTAYDLTYDTSSYTLPYPSGSLGVAPSGNLYGYFVVAPTAVSIQASVYNPRLNKSVTSNTIQLKVAVPPYLNGVWTIDSINQTQLDEIRGLVSSGISAGQRVPLGFRLRSSNVTLAAAVDGITFLDVNPAVNAPIYDQNQVAGSGVHVGHQVYVSGVHGTVL